MSGLQLKIRSFLAVSAILIGAASPHPVVIDVSKGSIDGHAAMGVWPVARGSSTAKDPSGYQFVLAHPYDPAKPPLRYPAGTWQLPPIGEYLMLLEGKDEVSPFPARIKYLRPPFEGKGWAILHHIVPAGRVVPRGACPSGPCTAWLLHNFSNVQSPVPYYGPAMLRQLALPEAARAGVLMPAGRVAVAIYDTAAKRFTGVQVPLDLKAATTVASHPGVPLPGRSAVIVELVRATPIPDRPQDDLKVTLIDAANQRRPPTFAARSYTKVIAIWTDVPAGAGRLEVHSSKDRLPDTSLQLRPQTIEHVTRGLAARG